jgi:hypothetical protein
MQTIAAPCQHGTRAKDRTEPVRALNRVVRMALAGNSLPRPTPASSVT